MDDDREDKYSTDVFINPALCLCSRFLLLDHFLCFYFPFSVLFKCIHFGTSIKRDWASFFGKVLAHG